MWPNDEIRRTILAPRLTFLFLSRFTRLRAACAVGLNAATTLRLTLNERFLHACFVQLSLMRAPRGTLVTYIRVTRRGLSFQNRDGLVSAPPTGAGLRSLYETCIGPPC